ncbi:ROK family transcriptional regulator [Microbacterium esteraromaticum]|uniref:ROK family transcriptional regulator n=1 Tax=Microbacterium esteraromaticum TaxID=57043 RepID=UPI0015C81DFB|nr:ROK family transcriptional regulator [Microbacterium esteraromaticum]MBN8424957.1 ROK family transcriptional regulator [Microbacterium esteraromaticum]
MATKHPRDITMLSATERGAIEAVISQGEASRATIGDLLALSVPRVSRVTGDLIEEGFLAPTGEVQRGSGRPVQPLQVVATRACTIGIKLTGEAAYAVLMNLGGEVVATSVRTFESTDVDDVVADIELMVAELSEKSRPSMIGISLAATVDPNGRGVHDASYLRWASAPLADLVGQVTGVPTVLSNDVNALTLVEHWFGAGQGHDDVAVVTIGTGVGCGLIANGELVHGLGGRSGLIGHMIVDRSGPLCDLGHRGCLAAFATIPSIVRQLSGYGLGGDFADLAQHAVEGHPAAERVFVDAAVATGTVLAYVVNILGPQRLILTGDGIAINAVAGEHLDAAYREHLHWRAAQTEVVVQGLDFEEWARGAATVALRAVLRGEAEAPVVATDDASTTEAAQ